MIPTLCIIAFVIGVLLVLWLRALGREKLLVWRVHELRVDVERLRGELARLETPKVKPVGAERMRQMGLER